MKMVIFEKWFINSARHNEQVIGRAEKLLQLTDVRDNHKYLEVGCGVGAVCKYVATRYGCDVTGVDVDPAQIKEAQESCHGIPNASFQKADATRLPFPDKDFDIVLSFGTTHHIPGWLDALGEIRRVMKPEGHFIYYDLVYTEPLARLGRLLSRNYGIVTMPDLNSFIQTNNFSTIHTSKKNSLIWYDYEAVYRGA
jgi:ubiquinone/menaquinone biosynthesis C-methylase UbiE